MPLDKFLIDPILSTYRGFVSDLEAKNCKGENYAKLVEAIEYIEKLANEYDGTNGFLDFNTRVVTENLYGKMSDYYSRALSEGSEAANGGKSGVYDDDTLMQMSLKALKDAIAVHKKNYEDIIERAKMEASLEFQNKNIENQASVASKLFTEEDKKFLAKEKGITDVEKYIEVGGKMQLDETLHGATTKDPKTGETITIAARVKAFDNVREAEIIHKPVMERIVKSIQAIIDIAEEPGMTYPRFLTIQLERGLFDATANQMSKEALEERLETSKLFMEFPLYIEEQEKKLNEYNKLLSSSKLGAPELSEWAIVEDEISREYEAAQIKYRMPLEWAMDIISDLGQWSLSYAKFAKNYDPWADYSSNPELQKQKIIESQKTLPGEIKAKVFQLKKYFDIDFANDFFTSDAFIYSVKSDRIDYSQEYVEFLMQKVFPECKPFNDLSQAIGDERETFEIEVRRNNPGSINGAVRTKAWYDQKFGEGEYEAKFGPIKRPTANAKPWDLSTFKFK